MYKWNYCNEIPTMLWDIFEESDSNLSIDNSELSEYNKGASTIGTKSLGKSLRKFRKKASFVSLVIPEINK